MDLTQSHSVACLLLHSISLQRWGANHELHELFIEVRKSGLPVGPPGGHAAWVISKFFELYIKPIPLLATEDTICNHFSSLTQRPHPRSLPSKNSTRHGRQRGGHSDGLSDTYL